jgi:hypothetical protein
MNENSINVLVAVGMLDKGAGIDRFALTIYLNKVTGLVWDSTTVESIADNLVGNGYLVKALILKKYLLSDTGKTLFFGLKK